MLLGNEMVDYNQWFYEIVWEKMKKGKKPQSNTEPQEMPNHRSEVRFMVTMTVSTLFLCG